MLTRCAWVGIAVLAAVAWLGAAGVASAQPVGECRTLSCNKCAHVCGGSCQADFVACEAKHHRGCPAAFRACERGCKSELCAQCLPIQVDGKNRKFLPGRTDICRSPGHDE